MTGNNKSFRIQDIILYNDDFLQLTLSGKLIDLIITSPPYNIGIDYGVYDDNKTYKEYLEFTKKWLAKSFELLNDGGRICINVPIDIYQPVSHKRVEVKSIAADITILAKRAGFKYKGTIIWNPSAALRTSQHEMVFSRDIEVILILYKGEWKVVSKEFKAWVNEIWNFSGESKKRVGHPAPFPVEIPRRLIKMFSEKGETILDPFMGSGTTMAACYLLQRKGVGVEISEEYFKIAKARIEKKKF